MWVAGDCLNLMRDSEFRINMVAFTEKPELSLYGGEPIDASSRGMNREGQVFGYRASMCFLCLRWTVLSHLVSVDLLYKQDL